MVGDTNTNTMFWYRKKAKEKPKKTKKDDFPLLEQAGIKPPRKVNYKARLDKWFAWYIRLRDVMPNGYVKCISCGNIIPLDKSDCGHYVNRQHMSLRFNEINCNAQCRKCNRNDEGNPQGYRQSLVKMYGEQKVLLLEAMKYQTRHFTNAEYIAAINHYKAEVKRLEKEKGFKISR